MSPRARFAFSRGHLHGDGGAERLERLEHQDAPQHPLQQGERKPAPQVRHLRAAQVPLVSAVLDEPAENVLRKGRLQPGHLFLVDLVQGRIVEDGEVESSIAAQKPPGRWFAEGVVHLGDLPERPPRVPRVEPLRSRQLAFGYTQEDMKVVLAPLARNAEEPIGSMGNDLALAVLRNPYLTSQVVSIDGGMYPH